MTNYIHVTIKETNGVCFEGMYDKKKYFNKMLTLLSKIENEIANEED